MRDRITKREYVEVTGTSAKSDGEAINTRYVSDAYTSNFLLSIFSPSRGRRVIASV
jgi:hypothetical protein